MGTRSRKRGYRKPRETSGRAQQARHCVARVVGEFRARSCRRLYSDRGTARARRDQGTRAPRARRNWRRDTRRNRAVGHDAEVRRRAGRDSMSSSAIPLKDAATATRLAIFDYGAGNLHSLVKAISADSRQISVETDIRAATKADVLVLPGVGAFGAAAGAMRSQQSYLRSALSDGLPCLGICLGMQLLFDVSEEAAGQGIGFIAGKVTRLRTSKVPHMGWNDIEWRETASNWKNPRLQTAYFANAFVCEPDDESPI